MSAAKEKLGTILVKLGLINKQELRQVLSAQQIFGGRIGTNTVNLNLLTVDQVSAALSRQKGVPEASADARPRPGAPDAAQRRRKARHCRHVTPSWR